MQRFLPGTLALLCACNANLIPNPDSQAALLPAETDVALGAKHDVLVIACEDSVTLNDLVSPLIGIGILTALGRVDAVFHTPGALRAAAIPGCVATDVEVLSTTVQGDAVQLIATDNPRVSQLVTQQPGTATVNAIVIVNNEEQQVQSVLRVHKPNRLLFGPSACAQQDVAYLRVGSAVSFNYRVFHDDTPLTGYDYTAVSHPRLDFDPSDSFVRVADERGAFTVTAPDVDPNFALDLFAYDVRDIDGLTLSRRGTTPLFVGDQDQVLASESIGGQSPCGLSGYVRINALTPDVCTYHVNGSRLVADQPGTCVLEASLVGSSLTQRLEIPIRRTLVDGPTLRDRQHVLSLFPAGIDSFFLASRINNTSSRDDFHVDHYVDGGRDSPFPPGNVRAVQPSPDARLLYGVGDNGYFEVWSVPFERGAGTRTPDDAREDFVSLAVRAVDDVFALTSEGNVRHFDGQGWQAVETGTTTPVSATWLSPSGDLYLGGDGLFRRREAQGWQDLLPSDVERQLNITRIRGGTNNEVSLVTRNVLYTFDGSTLDERLIVEAPEAITDVYITPDNTAYVLVGRRLLRHREASVVEFPLNENLPVLSGLGDKLWLAGQSLKTYVHDPNEIFPPDD